MGKESPKKTKLGRLGLGAGIVAVGTLAAIAAQEGLKMPEIEKCQADQNGAVHDVLEEIPAAPAPTLPPPLRSRLAPTPDANKAGASPPLEPKPEKITVKNVAMKIKSGDKQALMWLWQKADNYNGGTLDTTNLTPLDLYLGQCDHESNSDAKDDLDFLEEFGISLSELDIATRGSALSQLLEDVESASASETRLGESAMWYRIARILDIQGKGSNSFDPLFLQHLGKTRQQLQDTVRSVCAYQESYGRFTSNLPIDTNLLKQLYEIE